MTEPTMTPEVMETLSGTYLRLVTFTENLLQDLEKRLGPHVRGTADTIQDSSARQAWAGTAIEKQADMYVEIIRFTIQLLDHLKDRHGEKVADIVRESVFRDETDYWETVAADAGSHTLNDFIGILWDPLPLMGFEFSMEKQEDRVSAQVTRCPAAELARTLGASEWFYLLYCERDFINARTFNPSIRFNREFTLVQGHGYCDFYYYVAQ